jgi:MEDS: MEthanogen/methylotroph, DcmR Sensory domain
MQTTTSTSSTGTKGFHGVRFYESERSLAKIVSEFLLEGFADSHPGIVVATPGMRAALVLELAGSADVVELQRSGQLLLLDANEQLAAFMTTHGEPDPAGFDTMMCQAIDRACGDRTDCTVRIFGQMVDVLWRAGQQHAAIQLEMLWNQLAHRHTFSLLCGYAMGHFYKDANFEDICSQHSHVSSDGGADAGAANNGLVSHEPRMDSAGRF